MLIRRCAQLFVELDHEPRFDFASLVQGGDGLDKATRWRAFAPHLSEPVTVTLSQLAVLESLEGDTRRPLHELLQTHSAADVRSLVDSGLLMSDESDVERQRRDDTMREIAWWPPAALAQAHGAWLDVDIQARSEVGLMLNNEEMVKEFGEAPDPKYRRSNAPALPLLPPSRRDFDVLLALRRTCRNFDPIASVSATELATMLYRVWGAIGTLELAPGAVAVKKNSPAGGGLHAIEAYLLVQRAEGLQPGLYHYLSLDHALEQLQAMSSEEAAAHAHSFVAGQSWFNNVPVIVVMTARFDRLFWKYRRHAKAWRVVHLDVGHLSQTMYLSAAEMGLGSFVTAAINDRAVEQALKLKPMQEGAIAIVGFGPKSQTKITMELDNLVPTRANLESNGP
jgi:putative peptide maturation dehydrogenase